MKHEGAQAMGMGLGMRMSSILATLASLSILNGSSSFPLIKQLIGILLASLYFQL